MRPTLRYLGTQAGRGGAVIAATSGMSTGLIATLATIASVHVEARPLGRS
jgi:hypothetical protein